MSPNIQLALMRHGEAQQMESDSVRPLTPRGITQVREIAAAVINAGYRFDRILHSPILRAVQTAEIIQNLLRPKENPQVWDCLKPQGHAAIALERIEDLMLEHPGENIFIVSHMPFIGELAKMLQPSHRQETSFPVASVLILFKKADEGSRPWEFERYWVPQEAG